jgi:hypothetical protein
MTEKVYTSEAEQSTLSAIDFKQRVRAGLFAKVPLEVLTTNQLTPAAKQVWTVLACFQGNNGACWPGLRTLAKFAGLSLSGTKHALKELQQKGFLKHKFDDRKMRHSFSLEIPVAVIEEFCQRTGTKELLTRVQSSPQPSAPTNGDFRAKSQGRGEAKREIDLRAEWAVWEDVTPPPYLREKYERARGEDDFWNGLSTVSAAQSAVQNENQAPGAQTGTGECPNEHSGVLNRALGGAQMSTRVEGSAQTGTAFAETHNTYMDKTIEKTTDKKEENSLKDLAPNEEESKSKPNFQLGQEEKSRLETKNSSAESEILEQTSKAELPSSSNGSSLPSAGFSQAKGSYSEGLNLDPKAIPGAVYAKLPVWARFALSGLSDLRRELAELEAALGEAQGDERVRIEARIQEIAEEIAFNEARLAELLTQGTGQPSGPAEAAVAVGGEVRS